jgi:poly-gamma-glutamate synthesis protein (capsule biosynthesis protein)
VIKVKKQKRVIVAAGVLCTVITVCVVSMIACGIEIEKSENDITQNVLRIANSVEHAPRPLLFVGDIMMGRYVEKRMNENGEVYPFALVHDLLKKHTVIANLEGPIPVVHEATPAFGFRFSFPLRAARILHSENIAAVSLANNHGFDMGEEGYVHTKKIVNTHGVVSFGSYDNSSLDYYSTKLGTTSVTVIGINMVSDVWDEKRVIENVQKIIRQQKYSVVVAFLHWGNEYSHTQTGTQREFAHKIIDSGVGVIVGSHSHVTQGVELYKGRPIFYSLGNFIFDQYFSDDVQQSIGIEVQKFGEDIVFAFVPFESNVSQVSVATGTKAEVILGVVKMNATIEMKKRLSGNELRIPVGALLNE